MTERYRGSKRAPHSTSQEPETGPWSHLSIGSVIGTMDGSGELYKERLIIITIHIRSI